MRKIIAAGRALSNQRSAISQSDHRNGREERKGGQSRRGFYADNADELADISARENIFAALELEKPRDLVRRPAAENRSNACPSSHRRASRRGWRVRLKAGRSSQCCASRCATWEEGFSGSGSA